MHLASIQKEVAEVVEGFKTDLKGVKNSQEIAQLRNRALEKIKAYFQDITQVPPTGRAQVGRLLNQAIEEIQTLSEKAKNKLRRREFVKQDRAEAIDITAPWHVGGQEANMLPYEIGWKHPISEEIEKMIDIFTSLGFDVYVGKELDSEKYVFDYLNIPPDHPAREAWDTFYTEEGFVPTTHTSNMQIRVIRKEMALKQKVQAIVVGKTFRNEELDARHSHTFYQMEGVVVSEDASLGQLLYVLKTFLSIYFGRELNYKVLPAHFPFVEPGLEFAVECVFCQQKGKCQVCGGKGWLEIVGAGMIHPRVLEYAGVDPAKYQGFAWGFGIDRLVMSRQGIDDIRDLYSNNLNMLKRLT